MKLLIIAVTITTLISGFFTPVSAVDSRAIEAVRGKNVLDNADLQAIDDFVSQAVNEILNTDDFASISSPFVPDFGARPTVYSACRE